MPSGGDRSRRVEPAAPRVRDGASRAGSRRQSPAAGGLGQTSPSYAASRDRCSPPPARTQRPPTHVACRRQPDPPASAAERLGSRRHGGTAESTLRRQRRARAGPEAPQAPNKHPGGGAWRRDQRSCHIRASRHQKTTSRTRSRRRPYAAPATPFSTNSRCRSVFRNPSDRAEHKSDPVGPKPTETWHIPVSV